MNKMMSIVLMITGLILMCGISIIYSFSTIEISKVMYITLWCGCIVLIRLAASFGFGLER